MNERQLYDWESVRKSPLYESILTKWTTMLGDKDLKEQDYHEFLRDTPFFFLASDQSYLVVSKLRMGGDYETDFVVVEEGYSDGTEYVLVEIESPHDRLFDSKGNPSSKFNSALQQIRDWKRFIKSNSDFTRKYLPSVPLAYRTNKIKIRYRIVIGRRNISQEDLEKRNQISENENVEIMSFDRLTERARRRHFTNLSMIYASQLESKPVWLNNKLANPFFKCSSDSEWRSICKNGNAHIYSILLDDILRIRKYNQLFHDHKHEFLLESL